MDLERKIESGYSKEREGGKRKGEDMRREGKRELHLDYFTLSLFPPKAEVLAPIVPLGIDNRPSLRME